MIIESNLKYFNFNDIKYQINDILTIKTIITFHQENLHLKTFIQLLLFI